MFILQIISSPEFCNLPPTLSYTLTEWKAWRQMGQLLALTVHARKQVSCSICPQTSISATLLSSSTSCGSCVFVDFDVSSCVCACVVAAFVSCSPKLVGCTSSGRPALLESLLLVAGGSKDEGSKLPSPTSGNAGTTGGCTPRFSRQTIH